MPSPYPEVIDRLIGELSKLPGIGKKSAERILFHLLKNDASDVLHLANLMKLTKDTVRFCRECGNLSQKELCQICEDPGRNRELLLVVEEPKDVVFVEKSSSYHGYYHVLLGRLSPLEGIGPKQLKIDQLFQRVSKLGTTEIIIATNSNAEGETTALFLNEALKEACPQTKVSRIARGIPMGSQLEYLDPVTLARAIEGRTAL